MCKTRGYVISSTSIERELLRAGGDPAIVDLSRVFELREFELKSLGPHDVKLKILAVSAEHNVAHAALSSYVDIVHANGGEMVPGNSAVGEVVELGSGVGRFKLGDIVQTHCNGKQDRFGYPERIFGFDLPGSVGVYCEHAVLGDWQILPVPLGCGLRLWQLAALPLRAPTAYHLWRRAIGIYRLKVSRAQHARLHVLSFGGGVGELFLMLAKSEGHTAYFCSRTPERRDALSRQGIIPIDQSEFHGFSSERDVANFRAHVRQVTPDGMHVVCDMLRGPLFAAGLAVAARQGVNVSAGWQLSQVLTYNSAIQCVKQVTIDHAHYETIPGCAAAIELYGSAFRPVIHHEVYPFEDLPRCFQEMHRNEHTGIPIVRVATNLPAAVRAIA